MKNVIQEKRHAGLGLRRSRLLPEKWDAKKSKKLDKKAEKTHHQIKSLEQEIQEDIKSFLADKTAKDLNELLDKYFLEHKYFRKIIKKQNTAELRLVTKLKKASALMEELGLDKGEGDVKEVYDEIKKLLAKAHDEIEELKQHARDVAHGRERGEQMTVYSIDRLFHAVKLTARDEKRVLKKVRKYSDTLSKLIKSIEKNKAKNLKGIIKKLKNTFDKEKSAVEREIRDIAKIEHYIFNIAQRERKDDEHEINGDLNHLRTNGFPDMQLQELEAKFKENMDEIDHMNQRAQAEGSVVNNQTK